MRKLAVLCVTLFAASGFAAEPQEHEARIKELEQRIADQDRKIADLQAAHDQAAQNRALREDIQAVLKEMRLDAEKQPAVPSWMENLKFFGDFRLRYQVDDYDWGTNGDRKNRNRARVRLRFGVTKTWLDDQLEVTFRLATGESDDPTSTTQTFTGGFSKKNVWLDLAYARYSPLWCKGLTVIAGKMKNPWLTNEIFWDVNVNPEGAWAEYKLPLAGPVEPFIGAGYFVFQERAGTQSPIHDTILYGYQGGATWKIDQDVKTTVAAYYQDWDHYDTSGVSARGNDSPLTRVPAFGVIGLTSSVDFSLLKQPFTASFDWARNCDEQDSVRKYEDANNAYALGMTVGKNKKKGDWSVKYIYALVEANSLPGFITDATFGFTNRKGHIFRVFYNLLDNLMVGAALTAAEPIFSPTSTTGVAAEDKTITVQVDLLWKF